MEKFHATFIKLASNRNRKALFIILTLVGMAIAGGAPGAGSGIGGGPGVTSLFGY